MLICWPNEEYGHRFPSITMQGIRDGPEYGTSCYHENQHDHYKEYVFGNLLNKIGFYFDCYQSNDFESYINGITTKQDDNLIEAGRLAYKSLLDQEIIHFIRNSYRDDYCGKVRLIRKHFPRLKYL